MKNEKLQKQAMMLIERLPNKKLKAAIDYVSDPALKGEACPIRQPRL